MDIAQRIIDNGYIVNKPIEKTEEYGTQRVCGDSMIIACRWCRADAIQGLIDFNYNMSNRYAYQETPLHVLTWFHLNSEDLMKYSGTQFAKCVELLAHNGVDINAQDENGKTPLHIITGECAVKWVDDGTEFYKKTPTNRFCYNAEFLLDNMLQNGAKINIKDKDGNTPLHLVFQKELNLRTLSIFEKLIDNCPNVNIKDKDGNTPLHLALSKEPTTEMLTIVEKLIQKGARPDIHNQQMVTPYAQAFELLKNASPANKHIAQQILKLCQDAKPSLWAKMTRYFAGVQRSA